MKFKLIRQSTLPIDMPNSLYQEVIHKLLNRIKLPDINHYNISKLIEIKRVSQLQELQTDFDFPINIDFDEKVITLMDGNWDDYRNSDNYDLCSIDF